MQRLGGATFESGTKISVCQCKLTHGAFIMIMQWIYPLHRFACVQGSWLLASRIRVSIHIAYVYVFSGRNTRRVRYDATRWNATTFLLVTSSGLLYGEIGNLDDVYVFLLFSLVYRRTRVLICWTSYRFYRIFHWDTEKD